MGVHSVPRDSIGGSSQPLDINRSSSLELCLDPGAPGLRSEEFSMQGCPF